MNQCIRLVEALQAFSNLRPVDELKKATVGIISILGYSKAVRMLIKQQILRKNIVIFVLTFQRA
jgi:hypothetical protein